MGDPTENARPEHANPSTPSNPVHKSNSATASLCAREGVSASLESHPGPAESIKKVPSPLAEYVPDPYNTFNVPNSNPEHADMHTPSNPIPRFEIKSTVASISAGE
eukprot:2030246-Rhodomonas_salina.1